MAANDEGDAEKKGRTKVADPLFLQYPDFFDVDDGVQVKYEMLRRHHVDGLTVVEVARRFGFSRQGFYLVDAAFRARRLPGLTRARPGPKGPRKVTDEMAAFLRSTHRARPEATVQELAEAAAERFGIRVHPRTARRVLKKKHLAPEQAANPSDGVLPPNGGPDPTGL